MQESVVGIGKNYRRGYTEERSAPLSGMRVDGEKSVVEGWKCLDGAGGGA